MKFELLTCPVHGYHYVSMPRLIDEDEPEPLTAKDKLYICKCPVATCDRGVRRPLQDVAYEGNAGEMTRVR